MTNVERELYFKIMDDVPSGKMPVYMWHISNLRRRDEVLWWLVSNGITGKRFLSFVDEHEGLLGAASVVLQKIHKEKERHKIIHGVDYIDNQKTFSIGGNK